MNEIKSMIESAPTKMMAINMLNTWQLFGNITDKQYIKGRKLITKEFS
jgi:hypothetical protein